MHCDKCGKELTQNGECLYCKHKSKQNAPSPQYRSSNAILLSALSYLFFLWIIGLLITPDKYDSRVRFHVGQGMILTIFGVLLNIFVWIVNAGITLFFHTQMILMGSDTQMYGAPIIGNILSGILLLATYGILTAFVIIGIINALKEEKTPLPFIGYLAFYK